MIKQTSAFESALKFEGNQNGCWVVWAFYKRLMKVHKNAFLSLTNFAPFKKISNNNWFLGRISI